MFLASLGTYVRMSLVHLGCTHFQKVIIKKKMAAGVCGSSSTMATRTRIFPFDIILLAGNAMLQVAVHHPIGST